MGYKRLGEVPWGKVYEGVPVEAVTAGVGEAYNAFWANAIQKEENKL